MPAHLGGRTLTSRSVLEGERKQVIGPFADLEGSIDSLADRNPQNGRMFLDPVLERLMAVVHRHEGTGDQVMGDGIVGLQEGSCDTTLPCCQGLGAHRL